MFGERFINLLRTNSGPRASADLAVLWPLLQAELPPEGPCTLYLGDDATLSGDLSLDSRFSVLFGPGATVTLRPGVSWTILGDADLGSELRFRLAPGARVVLLGPLSRILPEWWDVAADPDSALENAFALAGARILEGKPQAVVELLGPYELGRTLSLSSPTGGEVEYVVEGRHPRGDAKLRPTLAYAPASSGDFSLIALRDGVRLIARRVAFDTTTRRGDPKRRAQPALALPERSSGTSLERCTFFVQSGGAVGVEAPTVSADQGATREHRRLYLRECWFESRATSPGLVTMLHVAPGARTRLGIDGCTFRGAANAMVSMTSGVCEVTGSDFENQSASIADPGVDFELGAATAGDGGAETLAFSELHCRSYSFRHVIGGSAGKDKARLSNTIGFTGLVHAPRYGDLAINLRPPAISWVGVHENEILVQGCDIAGTIVAPAPNRIALLASTLRGSPSVLPDQGRVVSPVAPR